MMKQVRFSEVLTALLLCATTLLNAASGREIEVFPFDCSQTRLPDSKCIEITDAFKSLNQSNTTLYLFPGEHHVLEEFTVVQGVRNIAILGVVGPSVSVITVTCSKDVGLAFVNNTNLTIQHIAIKGCGMSEEGLRNAVSAIDNIVDSFFEIPHSLNVAVIIGDVWNLNFEHVTIMDTPKPGIGLLGVNVMGSSLLNEVTFLNNTYKNCSLSILPEELRDNQYDDQIGGGAFLIYYDYQYACSCSRFQNTQTYLKISGSIFKGNGDCSLTGTIGTRMRYSPPLRSIGYTVGAGGGLSLVLTQMNYSVTIVVDSSIFLDNRGRYGAGAHIANFLGSADSQVLVTNCNFVNGTAPYTNMKEFEHSGFGGGLAFLPGFTRSSADSDELYSTNSSIDVSVMNSTFTGNSAFSGGGAYSIFAAFRNLMIKFTFENCSFVHNRAPFGAAIYVYERNVIIGSFLSESTHAVIFSNVYIGYNSVNSLQGTVRRNIESSGIIDVRYTHFTVSGKSTLEKNSGTALRARRSLVRVSGDVKFIGNVGTFGGALSFVSYSFLVVQPNTSLMFKNNRATVNGGVFYVEAEGEPNYVVDDCFLFLNTSDDLLCFDSKTCSNVASLGITITFSGNRAPLGSVVYGSSLTTCFWLRVLTNKTGNLWEFLANGEQTKDIFHFDSKNFGVSQFTTPPLKLTVYGSTEHSAMPGQEFNITMAAEDGFFNNVTATIFSAVMAEDFTNNESDVRSVLGLSNYWFLRNNTLSEVPVRVYGQQNQKLNVTIFTTSTGASAEIEVTLTECLLGFEYSDESSCTCKPELEENGVVCSSETHQITVSMNIWVGPIAKQDLTIHKCVYDYCRPGERVIDAGDFDAQCAEGYHRTGLLCGSCEEGYSIVFGTRRCKQCSNNAYLAQILAFAVAGILLIAMIAFLKVSISEGYLNGLLLYSHTLSPYIFILAPKAPAIFLPFAFLNLDLGIETCFYDGMTALAYIGLQFVFPFYLFLLMALIVLLARRIKCMPWNVGISAGKTFATLLIISYTSIFRTCVEILRFVGILSLNHPHKGYTTRWAADPSVPYFRGWHAVLGTLSVSLAIVYLMTLPLILLFPSKAYSFKYTSKMKPLLDAIFAPYKPQFRFWIGVRLIVVIIISAASSFLRFPIDVFLLVSIMPSLLFVQMQIQPYRGFCRNATDSFLLTNIVIILLGILFFSDQYTGNNTAQLQKCHTIFSTVIVSLAYIVFLWVLLYHSFIRLPTHLQNGIEKYYHQSKIGKKLAQLYKQNENTAVLERVESDIDLYHRFRDEYNEEEETHFGASVSVMDAPQGSEGTAEITPITPPYQ